MTKNSRPGEISILPCPPKEFSGRFSEKHKVREIIKGLRTLHDKGEVILISGSRGSGKTSFLDWIEFDNELQSTSGEIPVINQAFMETPGMTYATYKDLLTQLQSHQKFGWFQNIISNPDVIKKLTATLDVIDRVSSVTGPGKPLVDASVSISRSILSNEITGYSPLLISFLEVFQCLSDELKKDPNRCLVIICDDVQWCSDPDFLLLKDLIRNIPPRIALIFSFRLQPDYDEKYSKILAELTRYSYEEIRLGRMMHDEVEEFAKLRAGLNPEDPETKSICKILGERLGEPLSLGRFFTLVKKRNLKLQNNNFEDVLNESLHPAKSIYMELDRNWKERLEALSILDPPISFDLICCMLEIDGRNAPRLLDDFDHIGLFIRIDKENYDFAHPALREYVKTSLTTITKKHWSKRAAKCLGGDK